MSHYPDAVHAALMHDADGLPFAVGPLEYFQANANDRADWLGLHGYGTSHGTITLHSDVMEILGPTDRERYRETIGRHRSRPLTTIGPTQDIQPSDLAPGQVITRYTEPSRNGEVITTAPCCGRRMTFTFPVTPYAVCCSCTMLFTSRLIEEHDGGHLASFTVALPITVATHRNPR